MENSLSRVTRTRRLLLAFLAFSAAAALGVSLPVANAETIDSGGNTRRLGTYQNQDWYIFVKNGEKVRMRFEQVYRQGSQNNRYDRTFRIFGPTGSVASRTLTMDEDAAVGTVVTKDFTNSSGQDVVWKIEGRPVAVNDSGVDTSTLTAHNQHSFDITAFTGSSPTASTRKSGRLWSPVVQVGQPTQAQSGGSWDLADIQVYYLTDAGYLWRAKYWGYNGIFSWLHASNVGPVNMYGDDIGKPEYRSLPATRADTDVVEQPEIHYLPNAPTAARPYSFDPASVGSGIKYYKVFYENPGNDLPVSAPLYDGTTVQISRESAPLEPTLSTPTINRNISGAATISWNQANVEGSTNLQIDTNNNGVFTDPVDVTVTQKFLETGAASIAWNGRDGQNNKVSPTRTIRARVQVDKAGEIHFLNTDSEHRGGLSVFLENPPAGTPAADRSRLHWDDRALSPLGGSPSAPYTRPPTSNPDGRAGIESNVPGGVHDLPGDSSTEAWGNDRLINDWTYLKVDVQQTAVAAGMDALRVAKASSLPAGQAAVPDQEVTYTVTVSNTGSQPFTAADPAYMDDDMSGVADDATYVAGSLSSSSGTVTKTGNKISWSGPLAAGASATITYKVKINNPMTGNKTVLNAAVVSYADAERPATIDTSCGAYAANMCARVSYLIAAITIEKTSNRDSGGNPPSLLASGTSVTWSYKVTNIGSAPATGVAVVDDKGVSVSCPSTTLAAGATMTCTGTATLTN